MRGTFDIFRKNISDLKGAFNSNQILMIKYNTTAVDNYTTAQHNIMKRRYVLLKTATAHLWLLILMIVPP